MRRYEKFDALIDTLKGETDMKKRQGMIIDAVKMHADNIYHLPLHLQVIPWAARANVQLIHRADNRLEAAWVTL